MATGRLNHPCGYAPEPHHDPPQWLYGLAMTSTDKPPTVVETTVKAALRAIPYVGSSLSTIFEDTRA